MPRKREFTRLARKIQPFVSEIGKNVTRETIVIDGTNDHGNLLGLTDVADHPGYLLTDGTRTLSGDLQYTGNLQPIRASVEYTGYVYVPMPTPATYAAINLSTTAATVIDVSANFTGVPANVKAVAIRIDVNDSAAPFIGGVYFSVGPSATYFYAVTCATFGGDHHTYGSGMCPCDANGDIYYRCVASGTATMDVSLSIWGFWI
jgi:hypothetical protein